MKIPTSLLIRLSSVQTPEDFINSFVVGAPDRIRTDSSSRKENVPGLYEDKIATFATCQVRPTIVDVPVPTNAAELRWPSCVEVNRCRGCCSDYMACNSTGVEIVYKKVYRVRYEGANSEYFTYVGEEHVPIETHKQNSCVCACKIPASECGPNQIYEDCQCKCVNGNEASSCRYPHEWNKSLCQCRCPVITGCATGQVFNHNTCSCDVDPNAAMTAGDDTALFSVFSPGT
ncbi:PREDICTED: platelet-derived growth factor subunit A-like [Priapulus caudatus]|uniref:Platelet-derived growth factor subunit A-like n=1 Tax=Priapulus caudatus TaxID=37621 RepID=A0ABM1EP67_PRICU|nr:PREDICTED: platelet-derived growth factor subunit A-like [Priapulus caudatus]